MNKNNTHVLADASHATAVDDVGHDHDDTGHRVANMLMLPGADDAHDDIGHDATGAAGMGAETMMMLRSANILATNVAIP